MEGAGDSGDFLGRIFKERWGVLRYWLVWTRLVETPWWVVVEVFCEVATARMRTQRCCYTAL